VLDVVVVCATDDGVVLEGFGVVGGTVVWLLETILPLDVPL
jgi:hypothetical protein